MRKLLLIFIGFIFAGWLPAQEASLSGNWKAVMGKLDDGTGDAVYFQLQQNGIALTGRAIYPWGVLEVKDGKVEGTRFHFSLVPNDNFEFKVEGELSGNQLKYQSTSWGGKWEDHTASRAPQGEGNPPPRIEPPAIHAVPPNALARTPPMGWNSWNKFQHLVSDKVVRQMADVMVATGMRDAGYIYINIDDTWEGVRDADGVLQPNGKFPDMKALAGYVHSKGLKLGIYSSPGPKTCGGYEGSYGHEDLDAKTWAAWGVDYLKYDWCSASKIYKDTDLRAVYQKMGEALEKSGRPIVYSLCEYGRGDVWKWGPRVAANLWRTTGDINDSWESMSTIGFDQGRLASYAAPGHWNDPDMLEIGNGGMTTGEYRTHMTLWSILSAPLLAGNDLANMTDEIKSILMNREVIAIDQDPAGQQGQPISKTGDQEIWSKPLQDGRVAVALFNRANAPAPMTLNLADVQMPSSAKVRDLWAHQDVTTTNGRYTATVPGHGAVMLRIEKK